MLPPLNIFLMALTIDVWDSFWGRLLATIAVLIRISDGFHASLSHVTDIMIFSWLETMPFARRLSLASPVAKVRKIKSFVIFGFIKFINSSWSPL